MRSSLGVARVLTLSLTFGLMIGGMTACQTGEGDKSEAVSEPVSGGSEPAAKGEEAKTDAPGEAAATDKAEKPAKKDKAKKDKKKKKKK